MTKYVVVYFEGVEKIVSLPTSWLSNMSKHLGEPSNVYSFSSIEEVNEMLNVINQLGDVEIRRLTV